MRQLDFLKKYFVFLMNKNNKRDPNIWLFGEWFGKRCGDNATYLANYIVCTYPDIKVYWICDGECDTTILDSRIHVLHYNSEEAIKISKMASVIFVVEGIIDLNSYNYNYWGNAIKVNLWHGVPWKKIGDDAKNSLCKGIADYFRDIVYTFDLFQSPSDEYKKHILSAFHTTDAHVFNSGSPRNSIFFDNTKIRQYRRNIEKRIGESGFTLIAYLPTFRDLQTTPFSFNDIREQTFYDWIRDHNIYIIQKTHPVETGSFSIKCDRIINLEDISAQELMAASDMLITDYSSCFFDYLLLDRPIIHYLYDYDYYKNKDRGLYYEKEEVICGSAPETQADLIKAIKENYENPFQYHTLRMKQRAKFMTYEDSDSCRVITERVLEEQRRTEVV